MNSDQPNHFAGRENAVSAPVAPSPAKPKNGLPASRLRERLVLSCMALVTAAYAAIMRVQFDFSLTEAILFGCAVWSGLMLLHLHVKKNTEIGRLKAAIDKLEGHRGAIAIDSPYYSADQTSGDSDQLDFGAVQAEGSRRISDQGGHGEATHSQQTGLRLPDIDDGSAIATRGPKPQPRWEKPKLRPSSGLSGVAGSDTMLGPGTSQRATGHIRDPWAFRPKDAKSNFQSEVRDPEDGQPSSGLAANLESDLAMVQRKIKALAEEVNAAEHAHDRPTGFLVGSSAASAIDKSVGALKATADSMRERPAVQQSRQPGAEPTRPPASQPGQLMPFDLLIPATAERIAVSAPDAAAQAWESTPPAAPNARFSAIVAAIENGAMDVFLSPIVALQTHQVSHYDVTVRLKSVTGEYFDGAEQELKLASSDVLALFDTARLTRAAALAQRLDAHKKSGSLMSAVNGPSLTNSEFLETFARAYEERDQISNQLVLTFTQADVEMFSASAWQALGNMHAFGFRFALAQLDHLAMDFTVLAKRGFSFLRLDATSLMNGLPARERFVGPDELCRMLAGAGMTLVADTIDDEAVRARVFGFGVLFGQGRLFGGARQVKLDPLPARSSAAA